MSTQFELRLKGADAPDGEIDADHLLAIVEGLKEVATRIGRAETAAERVGRPPKRVTRVARLLIGLAPGSTRVLARRAGPGEGALDLDLADEQAFDERFAALVEAIGLDERPDWVDDSLSLAAADLAAALQQAAPEVEFRVDGRPQRTFKTALVRRETWQLPFPQTSRVITFVGRLYGVNLNTHHFRVQDAVGNYVTLPNVRHDAEAASLLDAQVAVTGVPQRDAHGRLVQIHDAVIAAAPDPLRGAEVPPIVTLDEILRTAPRPDPDAGIELTDEEFESFLTAARG